MKTIFRPTTLMDVAALPAVERSAGRRFLEVPELAWLADNLVINIEQHREYVCAGMSWVALADNQPVGFLLGEALDDMLFIAEVSLSVEWQRKGIGRQLIRYVATMAQEKGYASLALTTFRHVPWNAPFYARLGFEQLEDDAMPAALRQKREDEAAHGLPYESRCAMRLMLR